MCFIVVVEIKLASFNNVIYFAWLTKHKEPSKRKILQPPIWTISSLAPHTIIYWQGWLLRHRNENGMFLWDTIFLSVHDMKLNWVSMKWHTYIILVVTNYARHDEYYTEYWVFEISIQFLNISSLFHKYKQVISINIFAYM